MIRAKLVDTDIRLYELFLSLLASNRAKGKGTVIFEDFLKKKAKVSEAVVFGSGASALLAALTAMKKIAKGEKTEVLLPAYTPLSLYVTIKQAGLKPVLCDISLPDFGISAYSVREKTNSKTLAVIPVRLFGLESSPQGKNDGVFVIEDNAQSFILPLKWDVELLSFNRGKNFPLLNGGALLTNDEGLADEFRKIRADFKVPSLPKKLITLIKFKAFCLAKNRTFYNLLLPLIERFKDNKPTERINEELLSSWQCMLGAGKIFHADENMKKRYGNAKKYLELLLDTPEIELPVVKEGSVVNRFPVLIKDKSKVEMVHLELKRAGIESSRMYYRPLHTAYGLEHGESEFKNAEYAAEHLLTLPCHPFLSGSDIEYIAAEVKRCFR